MLAFLLWLLSIFGGSAPVADDAGAASIATAGSDQTDQVGNDEPDDPIKRCIKCTVH